jgi:hypothetical protein
LQNSPEPGHPQQGELQSGHIAADPNHPDVIAQKRKMRALRKAMGANNSDIQVSTHHLGTGKKLTKKERKDWRKKLLGIEPNADNKDGKIAGEDGVNQKANRQKSDIQVPTHDPDTGEELSKNRRKKLRNGMLAEQAGLDNKDGKMPGKYGVNQQTNGQNENVEVPTHDPVTGLKYTKKQRKLKRKELIDQMKEDKSGQQEEGRDAKDNVNPNQKGGRQTKGEKKDWENDLSALAPYSLSTL